MTEKLKVFGYHSNEVNSQFIQFSKINAKNTINTINTMIYKPDI